MYYLSLAFATKPCVFLPHDLALWRKKLLQCERVKMIECIQVDFVAL